MKLKTAREVLEGLDEIDRENLKVGRFTRTSLRAAFKAAGKNFDPAFEFDVILVCEQLNDMLQAGRELAEVDLKAMVNR